MYNWKDFDEIWVVDYEFFNANGNSGNIQIPVCYCAKEIYSGKILKEWIYGTNDNSPKYSTEDNSLFVAYFSSAEVGCHLTLNWSKPRNIVDLYAEFRNNTNGKYLRNGRTLLGACLYYGVPGGDATLKDTMRDRIIQGPPYSDNEIEQILNYCMKDVELTSLLFETMKKSIDLPRALLRGRYMWASACMEHYGVPIDVEMLTKLRNNWDNIKSNLIEKVDLNYGVYEDGVFKIDKFNNYLKSHNIPWEYTPSGRPKTDDDYLKEQAKTFPILKPLQELRYSLGQLKLNNLQVGDDGRNRSLLSPFGTLTGRNAPSSAKFIFGNAVWLRNLIKPKFGTAISYIDYEQQEIGIAAALSKDRNLIDAYESGDPYISFAKQAGAVPEDATKKSHPDIREQYKTCMLGINYGMHEVSFSKRVGLPLPKAKEIYKMHHIIYREYWDWIHSFMDCGQLLGHVTTRFGWKFFTKNSKSGTLQNFPMQGHGSDILRIAVCLCLENKLKVVAPVHDAILIEAPTMEIENDVAIASQLMTEASKHVINFPLRVESTIIRYPDHYSDRRGELMWNSIQEVLNNG